MAQTRDQARNVLMACDPDFLSVIARIARRLLKNFLQQEAGAALQKLILRT